MRCPPCAAHVALLIVAIGASMCVAGENAAESGGSAPFVELLSPSQGEVLRDGLLRVAWRSSGVGLGGGEGGEGGMHLIVVINGLPAKITDSAEGELQIGELPSGFFRVQVLLGTYSEDDGISGVRASSMAECSMRAGGEPDADWDNERNLWDSGAGPEGFTPYVPAVGKGDPASEPIVIMVFHCNRPDLLRLQVAALNTFMRDKFELLVIDDAPSPELREQFIAAALEAGAEHVATPDYFDHSNPSEVVGKVVTWAVQDIALKRFGDRVLFLLEGDMLPVAPFSALEFLRGFDIAGTHQGRAHKDTGFLLRYLWVGLLFINLKDLPNKHLLQMTTAVVGDVGGDTASALHHFFEASPDVRVRRVLHTSHIHTERGNRYVLPENARKLYQDAFRMELYERAFLHFGSASNWKEGRNFEYFNSPEDFLPHKTLFLKTFVEGCMNGTFTVPNYDYVFEKDTWENPSGRPRRHPPPGGKKPEL